MGSIGVQVCVLSGSADRAAISACWYSSPCASALHLGEIHGPDEGPHGRHAATSTRAASIPTTKPLASLLRSDGAGMSCGRGLGVRRRPTPRTSSYPRMHGRAGTQRRAGRLGRWTPGGLCCGASCWKPRPATRLHASFYLPATCHRAAVIGGSMGPQRPRTTATWRPSHQRVSGSSSGIVIKRSSAADEHRCRSTRTRP